MCWAPPTSHHIPCFFTLSGPLPAHLLPSPEDCLVGWQMPASLQPLCSTSLKSSTSQPPADTLMGPMNVPWDTRLTAEEGPKGGRHFSSVSLCTRTHSPFLPMEVSRAPSHFSKMYFYIPSHFRCQRDSVH